MLSPFAQGHGWTRVPKNVLMGNCDMIFATQGRSYMSEMTKEPCYRCTEGSGGKKMAQTEKGSQNQDL